ncbi:MAG TPA: ABC transporter ATP-binding protein [Spirochaetota bacterium]|nr:ABC transporter ATP-binding protein [Spirochaetota bacterium]
MSESVIQLQEINKKYNLYTKRLDRLKESLDPRKKIYHKDFYALKNINLQVNKGEIIGIVGKNGSGKSTLLKVISGVLTPTMGSVKVKGNVVALLELGSGFNPEFTGIENIYFYSALLGYKREEIDSIVNDIVEFSELENFIYQPIKTYSSGMKARLAFSVSVNIDPDILILDEVLSVGDELFRRKCFARMEEFFSVGKTILYVSHITSSINELCTRAVMLDRGELICDGPAKLVTSLYQKYLYSSKDKIDDMRKEIISLNSNIMYKKSIEEEIKEFSKKNINEVEHHNFDFPGGKKISHNPRSFYIPNLKPKSTVEYKNYNVEIFNIKLVTPENEDVNMLLLNKKYVYSYMVKFNCDAQDVSFGMLFKTEKGSHLGGGVAPGVNTYIPSVTKGLVFRIEWNFLCNFLQGIYYVNTGVRGRINGEIVYLNRIVDSLVFKVQHEYSDIYTGQLYFYQEPVIIPLIEQEVPVK